MIYGYLLLVLAAASEFFSLVPYSGPGNLKDIGIVLIFTGLLYFTIVRHKHTELVNVFFTWYIAIYFLMVLSQVSIATIKYGQPLAAGFIETRDQLYYLAFPLFMMALPDTDHVRRFLDIISIVAVVLVILTVIHFGLGITVFLDMAYEGAGIRERAGIPRIMIPGMDIIVIGLLWQFWRYLEKGRILTMDLLPMALTFGGLFIRQTRARLVTTLFIMFLMLIVRKRYGLAVLGVIAAISVTAAMIASGGTENPFFVLLTSTIQDLSEGTGTWGGRVQQFRSSLDAFLEGLLTGTGGLALHGTKQSGSSELMIIAYGSDLGYWTFVKFFGYWGILMIMAIIAGFSWYALRCSGRPACASLCHFTVLYFLSILISMVTIAYLTKPGGIVMVCLSWAMIVRAAEVVDVKQPEYA